MKYRVIKKTYKDGNVSYIPQEKRFIFWSNIVYNDMYGMVLYPQCSSKKSALEVIKNEQEKIKSRTVIKKEIIKDGE